jgi:HAD superfamily hydrolase (TIGR01484 family)
VLGFGSLVKVSKKALSADFNGEASFSQVIGCDPETIKTTIKCVVLDYDGTISPLNVPRDRSRVPEKTRVVLQRIARLIPIAIITTKDLSFVTPRTSFAYAWSTVSGLETKIGAKIRLKRGLSHGFEQIALALEYANLHLNSSRVEIEEKRESFGRTLAFCVDWRRANKAATTIRDVEHVETYCRQLGLNVVRYHHQPLFDVYPVRVDKGSALAELLRAMKVKEGVLYMGDSEADDPAFDRSNASIGVIHEENYMKRFTCDFYVKFQDVSAFLLRLLENNLVFESNFPMIEINVEKMKQKCRRE